MILIAISLKVILDAPLLAIEYTQQNFEIKLESYSYTGDSGQEYETTTSYMHADVLFHRNQKYSDYRNVLRIPYMVSFMVIGAIIGLFGITLFGVPLYSVLKKE